MVRAEAVTVALFSTVGGLGLGLFLAWALVSALAGEGFTTFAVPTGSLAVAFALGALAGVLRGAGSGMARRAARAFVREAPRVLATDIGGREEETAADLGGAVVPFHSDVTKEDQVEAMFAAALDAFGRVDAILDVVGIGGARALAEVTMEDDDRIMDPTPGHR